MSAFSIHNKWDPLEVVMLGDNYNADFFRDIKNTNIRSALCQIADETLEDLNYFEQVLKNHGIQVCRPMMDRSDSILNYVDTEGRLGEPESEHSFPQGVPRGPLEPRDCQLVINNHLFYTHKPHPDIQTALNLYSATNTVTLEDNIMGAPSYTLVNDRLLIDKDAGSECPVWYSSKVHPHTGQPLTKNSKVKGIARLEYIHNKNVSTIKQLYPDMQVVDIDEGGHTDGVFHTVKQGAILSIQDVDTHAKVFPDWDVLHLQNESWSKVTPFLSQKKGISKSWWVPDQEDNPELQDFVNTWLSDWVGFCEESVFDVNVLVLDPETVCINNRNPIVIDFLKKHNMGYIHVPWRHRFFWDGGLHCITLDLKRR